LSLREIGEHFDDLAKTAVLRDLVPEYLSYSGRKYALRRRVEWRLWMRAEEALRQKDTLAVEEVAQHILGTECVLGEARLRDAVAWVLRLMLQAGQAAEEGGGWSYVDVHRLLAALAHECTDLVSQCAERRVRIEAFDATGVAEQDASDFASYRSALETAGGDRPRYEELRDGLKHLRARLDACVERKQRERDGVLAFLGDRVAGARSGVDAVPGPLRAYLGLDEELEALAAEAADVSARATSPSTRDVDRMLDAARRRLVAKAEKLEAAAHGELSGQPPGKVSELLSELLKRGGFRQVTVHWESEA
jgi:hypothetical protein